MAHGTLLGTITDIVQPDKNSGQVTVKDTNEIMEFLDCGIQGKKLHQGSKVSFFFVETDTTKYAIHLVGDDWT